MARANYGGALSGAASGASTGATIGSIIPGVGTAVGGAVGGLFGGIAGLFGKKKKKKKTLSTLDKRQQQLNEQQHQSILGKGPLADLYNYDPKAANEVFEKTIANPAYRQFKEELAPQITGQFRSQGLQSSSYAGDALAKAGRDIQEKLDAERSKYLYGEQEGAKSAKRQAIENLQNRTTFDYQPNRQQSSSGGIDIDSILKSFGPDAIGQLKDAVLKYAPGGVS